MLYMSIALNGIQTFFKMLESVLSVLNINYHNFHNLCTITELIYVNTNHAKCLSSMTPPDKFIVTCHFRETNWELQEKDRTNFRVCQGHYIKKTRKDIPLSKNNPSRYTATISMIFSYNTCSPCMCVCV